MKAAKHLRALGIAADQPGTPVGRRPIHDRGRECPRRSQIDRQPAQDAADVAEGLMSRRRIFRQQSRQERIDRRWNRRQPVVERGGRLSKNGRKRGFDVRALEGMRARDQFIQQNAEREDVRAAIGRRTPDLLRRHIRRRTADFVRGHCHGHHLIDGVGVRQPRRQPEVHHLDVAIFREHHVRRLQVAVNDAPLVAASTASAISSATRRASPSRSGPPRSRRSSDSPRTYSIAMQGRPFSVVTS